MVREVSALTVSELWSVKKQRRSEREGAERSIVAADGEEWLVS